MPPKLTQGGLSSLPARLRIAWVRVGEATGVAKMLNDHTGLKFLGLAL